MKKIRLLYLFLIFPVILLAQNKNITGTILDENGAPLPGASVLVKGLTVGTSTDFDGNFSLNVPENRKTLVVSYLGYLTKEVTLGNDTKITIQLEPDASTLDEVVVLGYGTLRKSDITGAVTSIKVNGTPAAEVRTVDALLQGRAAGVQVTQNATNLNSGVSVRIRGASSLRGNNEPLYVVDGIIISSAGEDTPNAGDAGNTYRQPQNGLNGINPRDIESLEVLKDASATAIYGSRGANGVILITTKKGRAGKTNILAYTNASISKMNQGYDMLDGVGYAEYKNEFEQLNGRIPKYSISGQTVFPIYDENGAAVIGDVPLQQVDWQNEIYKEGFSNSTGLSLSGGGDKGNFYVSAGYNDQNGIVENSNLKSGNFSINVNQDMSDKFTINAKMSAYYSKGDFTQEGDRVGVGQRSFVGNVVTYPPLRTSAENNEFTEQGWTNPIALVNDYADIAEESRFFGSLSLVYNFNIEGLQYKLQAGGNIRNKERRQFYGLTTFQGKQSNGSLRLSDLYSKSYQINNLLTYNHTFDNKHSINGVVGMTYDVKNYDNKIYVVEDFSTTAFTVDQTGYGQTVKVPLQTLPSKSQLLSYLTRINYSFDNKYIFTGTFRADGSSKFAEGNKFSYFPSFSVAWRTNNENFLKNSETINDLKLRIGWGKTGNQGIAPYQTFANYGPTRYANPANGASIGFVPENVSNPDLIWETTKQLNAGLDFGLWNNRLTGTVDVYNKQTDDLLLNQPLGPSTGFSSLLVNKGSVNNKGMEFTLGGTLIDKKDFSIDVSGNVGFNKSEIQKLGLSSSDIYIDGELENRVFYLGQSISTGGYFNAPANIFMEGEEIGLFYGYQTNGIYQTDDDITVAGTQAGDIRIIDQNGDNVIDGNDRTIIGNPNPDFVYGGNLNIKYKRLSLNVLVNGVYGNEIVNGNLIILGTPDGGDGNRLSTAYKNAWRPEAQTNAYPRVGYDKENGAKAITDRIIEDGTYFRVNNITLGYDIPVENINIFSKANIYLSGLNLFTITDYLGYNPEITSFMGNGNITGVDWNGYPNARTVVLGLNLNF